MAGRRAVCTVQTIPSNTHFVKVPSILFEDVTVVIAEVPVSQLEHAGQDGAKCFVTVVGTTNAEAKVEAGNLLGLSSGDKVIVAKPSPGDIGLADKVTVTPVNSCDWDIIRYNEKDVERAILSQLRIVQEDTIVQIAVKSLKLRLRIDKVSPRKAAVLLVPMTELSIDLPDNNDDISEEEDEIDPVITNDDHSTSTPTDSSQPHCDNNPSFWQRWFPFLSSNLESSHFNQTFEKMFLASPIGVPLRVGVCPEGDLHHACYISSKSWPTPLHSAQFFATLSVINYPSPVDKKNGNIRADCSVPVKVIVDDSTLRGYILVPDTILEWKRISVGQQVFLRSLVFDQTMVEACVSNLWVSSPDLVTSVSLKDHLTNLFASTSSVWPNPSPVVDGPSKGMLYHSNNLPYIFPVFGTKVVAEVGNISDECSLEKLKPHFESNTEPVLTELFRDQYHDIKRQVTTSLLLDGNRSEMVRPGIFLVTGKKGSGKTTLVRRLTEELGISKHGVVSHLVNCVGLKGKKYETVRKRLQSAVTQLRRRAPAILVLDNLDSLIPEGEDDHRGSEEVLLAKWTASQLTAIAARDRKLVVLITAQSVDHLHPGLRPGKGRILFTKTVNIPPPSAGERSGLVNFYFDSGTELLPEEAMTLTEGFTPADIRLLCDQVKSRHGALEHSVLLAALKSFTPLSKWGVDLKPRAKRRLEEVGGLAKAREVLIQTFLWPLNHSRLYEKLGVRMPRGVLLYGMPGTGKTMLAEAIANHSGLSYIAVKGPELLSKYIGASETNVRDVFERAQAAKPCLVFFDEFDSLAPRRGHDSTGVTDRVVNQLLTQMDGVEGLDGVWILAATSRPDLIDPALLRPGRLDQAVLCPIPTQEDRLDILRKMTKDLDLSPCVNLEEISALSERFTGADFRGLLYTAHVVKPTTDPISRPSKTDPKAVHETCTRGSLTLTHSSLLMALDQTKPSVSESDLQKYNAIYETFSSGRYSGSTEQRATLA